MESNFEKIKRDKIKEATGFLIKLKLHLPFRRGCFFEIPIYSENNNPV